jgi:hypothetical protein
MFLNFTTVTRENALNSREVDQRSQIPSNPDLNCTASHPSGTPTRQSRKIIFRVRLRNKIGGMQVQMLQRMRVVAETSSNQAMRFHPQRFAAVFNHPAYADEERRCGGRRHLPDEYGAVRRSIA